MYSQGPSPFPIQPAPHTFAHHLYPSHQPHASATNNTLLGIYPPTHNLRGSLQMPLQLSWQHLNLSISQVVQRASLTNIKLVGTRLNGTLSPSPTLSCFLSCWRLILLLQSIRHLFSHHLKNGTMVMPAVIIMLGI